jgi:hypothetical protein
MRRTPHLPHLIAVCCLLPSCGGATHEVHPTLTSLCNSDPSRFGGAAHALLALCLQSCVSWEPAVMPGISSQPSIAAQNKAPADFSSVVADAWLSLAQAAAHTASSLQVGSHEMQRACLRRWSGKSACERTIASPTASPPAKCMLEIAPHGLLFPDCAPPVLVYMRALWLGSPCCVPRCVRRPLCQTCRVGRRRRGARHSAPCFASLRQRHTACRSR